MNASGKKFSLPEIIIMLLIAIVNDVCQILALFCFVIPGVGITIVFAQEFVDVIITAIFFFWFWMKAGSGGANMVKAFGLQISGGLAGLAFIPFARTIAVGLGIRLVNKQAAAASGGKSSPSGVTSTIGKVAQVAEMV